MKGIVKAALVVLATLLVAGCTTPPPAVVQEKLVVYSPHPMEFIDPIVAEFEATTGIAVEVQSGGTGTLLGMVEQNSEPLCDVVWGGSLSTVLTSGELFAPYTSQNAGYVRPEFRNVEGNLTRFTDIPSVLMVNLNLIGELRIEGYADLLQPQLRGNIAMCDPVTSSSAQEHLVNMLYAMGNGNPDEGWGYVEEFCRNLDGKLLQSSSDVYRGVAEGRYAVGLTFEEGAARYVAGGDPIAIVYMDEGVISTPDVVCVARSAPNPTAAQAFVDFVTGKDAQTMIASRLNRRSVRTDVEEPPLLADKDTLNILYVDTPTVTASKDEWVQRFSDIYSSVQAGESTP